MLDAPLHVLEARALDEVRPVLREAERQARDGRWAVGWVAYEAAPAFDAAMPGGGRTEGLPLARFAIHESARRETPPPRAARGTSARWLPDVDRLAYDAAIRTVRDGIARGDWYQVNHTFRLHATVEEEGRELYEGLRAAQRARYALFLRTATHDVLSLSPELFLETRGRRIVSRPMKGTAARSLLDEEDTEAADRLRGSPKERAENVMIVDLVRNDMGRVAVPGSVRVPSLFAVERYPTVWQMTSTVEATLRDEVRLDDVFAALFPCGSITGAPKIAAMQAIARLERSPRGPYCGAVGVIAPGGDATFNVAIRTLVLERASRRAVYGVGGGVTWDSTPEGEYDEALAKGAVLGARAPAWSLFETMRLEQGAWTLRAGHLARLARSAERLGFAHDPARCEEALDRFAAEHGTGLWRVRLVLASSGEVVVEGRPFVDDAGPKRVRLARTAVSSRDPLLRHKTTERGVYERHAAEAPDAWDVLLRNEREEVTEFTRGTVVLELDGARVTPPVRCGLLPGVRRAELLAREEAVERVVTVAELSRATRVWFVNALRGWIAVEVERG